MASAVLLLVSVAGLQDTAVAQAVIGTGGTFDRGLGAAGRGESGVIGGIGGSESSPFGGGRSSLAGWRAYRSFKDSELSSQRDHRSSRAVAKFGPLEVGLSSSIFLEYDSNPFGLADDGSPGGVRFESAPRDPTPTPTPVPKPTPLPPASLVPSGGPGVAATSGTGASATVIPAAPTPTPAAEPPPETEPVENEQKAGSDLLLGMSLSGSVYWRVSRMNEIDIVADFALRESLSDSGRDESFFSVSPSTALNYRLFFSDFVLNLYAYPSIEEQREAIDSAIAAPSSARLFANRAGLSLLWHANRLILLAGYERFDQFSLEEEELTSQDSSAGSLYALAAIDLEAGRSIGVRFSATDTVFDQDVLNNNRASTIALFYESRPSRHTTLSLEVGLQNGRFDSPLEPQPKETAKATESTDPPQSVPLAAVPAPVEEPDIPDPDGETGEKTSDDDIPRSLGGGDYTEPFFSLGIKNRLNRFITQHLQIYHGTELSSVSNFRTETRLEYRLDYRLNRITRLGGFASWAWGEISSDEIPVEFEEFGVGVSMAVDLRENMSLGVSFTRSVNTFEEAGGADYSRDVLIVGLNYTF